MSAIDGMTGTNTTTVPKQNITTKAMGKDDFLKMLIAQLKNQDPTNPQQGTEFAAQLAQYSSLEQLTNLNETMTRQGLSNNKLIEAQAVNLIGKQITAQTERTAADGTTGITPVNGQVTAINYRNNEVYLTVNDAEIPFGDVLSVSQ